MSHDVVWPPPVAPGATIGVVAPAGPCDPDSLDRGLAALRERGFAPRLGEHVRERRHYLAGSDAQRAADLLALWADPEVDAVWCARGGYGTMRLLPLLDWDLLARPRPLIGYSDVTALQLALAARHGLVTFSGPMVGTGHGFAGLGGLDAFAEASLWQWLQTREGGDLANPPEQPLTVLRNGLAEGRLLGGNLSLVAALAGTPFLPDLRGAILVIEDVGESPYRVDRMLTQLRLAGHLDAIGGLVIGDFADSFPPACADPGPPVEELVLDLLGDGDIPVISGFAYGHISRRCTLPLGAWCRLDTAGPALTVDLPPAGGMV